MRYERKETIERNNNIRQQMKDMILQDKSRSQNYLKEHIQHSNIIDKYYMQVVREIDREGRL